jgi:hypothetical protein
MRIDRTDAESILVVLAQRATQLLILVLRNDKLDLSGRAAEETDFLPTVAGAAKGGLPKYRWKPALKLRLIRELWRRLRLVFPEGALAAQAERFLHVLMRKEADLVVETESADEVRVEWALLCAEVVGCCDEDQMPIFWGMGSATGRPSAWNESVRCLVWTQWVQKWIEEAASWDSGVILLGAPFL